MRIDGGCNGCCDQRIGKYFCQVYEYIGRQTQCFSTEEIARDTSKSEQLLLNCLSNLLALDVVCKNGQLWCPDYP